MILFQLDFKGSKRVQNFSWTSAELHLTTKMIASRLFHSLANIPVSPKVSREPQNGYRPGCAEMSLADSTRDDQAVFPGEDFVLA